MYVSPLGLCKIIKLPEFVATFMNFASLPENLCVLSNKDGRPNNGGDVQTPSTTQPCVSKLTDGDLSEQPDPNQDICTPSFPQMWPHPSRGDLIVLDIP